MNWISYDNEVQHFAPVCYNSESTIMLHEINMKWHSLCSEGKLKFIYQFYFMYMYMRWTVISCMTQVLNIAIILEQ